MFGISHALFAEEILKTFFPIRYFLKTIDTKRHNFYKHKLYVRTYALQVCHMPTSYNGHKVNKLRGLKKFSLI